MDWLPADEPRALNGSTCAVDSSEQLGTFKDFIKTFPEIDTPEIFGLHPNADLTFRVKEVNALFGTLGNTQPKVHFHVIRLYHPCRMKHTCLVFTTYLLGEAQESLRRLT